MRVETPLLVLGRGPAALVAAKVAGAYGQPCLLVGHEITSGDVPVELDRTAIDVLEEYGLIDVLRPHLLAVRPPAVVPCEFERGLRGALSDGRSRWELVADTWIDAGALAATLPAAIPQGAAAVVRAIGG